jgi:PHD/YefM family antitoxin component YafN of YafNO toxin-antitoxin module
MKSIDVVELEQSAAKAWKLTESEDVLILQDGKPVGILRRFSDQEDFADEELERSPAFLEAVRRSQQQFKDGKCARIEDVWSEIMNAPEPK